MGDVPQFVQVGMAGSEAAPVLVTKEKFAAMSGLPVGVVIGFANRRYLPMVNIGRYSLVNLELLRKQCLDREMK